MEWYALDTWIVIVGALCGVACALLGNYLVLRQMSMMGDAISHAVLPGLAIGFLLTASRASLAMFLGAAIVGVLTAVFTQWISKLGNVDRGASMGIVFTTLFALGLVMIVQAADYVDLDPGCVLYGAIELTPLDVAWEFTAFGTLIEVPRAALILGAVTLLNALFLLLCFKEMRITSFDPALANTLGFRSSLMHYLLMMLVAITTVASFEAVGSILVIAMLIVPPATAALLTRRLSTLVALSAGIGVLCAVLGHISAITVPKLFGYEDTSTSGMMAVVAGVLFALAMVANILLRRQRTRKSAPAEIPGQSEAA